LFSAHCSSHAAKVAALHACLHSDMVVGVPVMVFTPVGVHITCGRLNHSGTLCLLPTSHLMDRSTICKRTGSVRSNDASYLHIQVSITFTHDNGAGSLDLVQDFLVSCKGQLIIEYTAAVFHKCIDATLQHNPSCLVLVAIHIWALVLQKRKSF